MDANFKNQVVQRVDQNDTEVSYSTPSAILSLRATFD